MKRIILGIFLLFSLGGCRCASPKDGIRIESVALTEKTDADFKGIAEALSHRESFGNVPVVRSDTKQRAGLYFTIRLSEPWTTIPLGSTVRLTFVTNRALHEQQQTWPLPSLKSCLLPMYEIDFGLTDAARVQTIRKGDGSCEAFAKQVSEEVDATVHLSAWKVEILHPDGTCIASGTSYAW